VYVVGDTPADIACGAASGMRTVGVATGPDHSFEHLRACSPEYLFEDLRGLLTLEL
jgi:phosphoglycolate phosphatase-like HAD superfamily hydrolase